MSLADYPVLCFSLCNFFTSFEILWNSHGFWWIKALWLLYCQLDIYDIYAVIFSSLVAIDYHLKEKFCFYHLLHLVYLPPANEVCEGYVFTGVCQSFCSQGRWGHMWLLWGGVVALGGMCGCSGGMCGCSWGACMVALGACVVAPGGMHGCSGGGMHGCSGGACMGYDKIRRYNQWGGGTYPTGMHSCCYHAFSMSLM